LNEVKAPHEQLSCSTGRKQSLKRELQNMRVAAVTLALLADLRSVGKVPCRVACWYFPQLQVSCWSVVSLDEQFLFHLFIVSTL